MDSLTLDTKFDDKLTELLQQRVGVTDQLAAAEGAVDTGAVLPAAQTRRRQPHQRRQHATRGIPGCGAQRTRSGVDASGLKAQALQALEKCIEQATKNSQLSELLLKASGTDDPINMLLNELRSKDGSFAESRGFQKRLCAAIAKQDRDDMTQKLKRSQQVRLVSGLQQWVALPFALPASGEARSAADRRLPTRCVCNQPNPFAKDPAALRKISAFRRHQMVVCFIESFVHRHGGTVVNGPTHIGGYPSKKQVELRIRIGELFVDGDVHIHNPTSGSNTSKTPFAVTKKQRRTSSRSMKP